MKNKNLAINTHLISCTILLVIFIYLSISSFTEHKVWMSIGFAVVALMPAAVFLLSPLYFVFDEQEVVIVYTLGKKESIKWKDIKSITAYGSLMGGGLPSFEIAYPTNEERTFFMRGEIVRNHRTKKLIQKYYKGIIQ